MYIGNAYITDNLRVYRLSQIETITADRSWHHRGQVSTYTCVDQDRLSGNGARAIYVTQTLLATTACTHSNLCCVSGGLPPNSPSCTHQCSTLAGKHHYTDEQCSPC